MSVVQIKPLCPLFKQILRIKDVDPNSVCTICFDSTDVMYDLSCEHIFHPDCLDIWFEKNNRCPLCRYKWPHDEIKFEIRDVGIDMTLEEWHRQSLEHQAILDEFVLNRFPRLHIGPIIFALVNVVDSWREALSWFGINLDENRVNQPESTEPPTLLEWSMRMHSLANQSRHNIVRGEIGYSYPGRLRPHLRGRILFDNIRQHTNMSPDITQNRNHRSNSVEPSERTVVIRRNLVRDNESGWVRSDAQENCISELNSPGDYNVTPNRIESNVPFIDESHDFIQSLPGWVFRSRLERLSMHQFSELIQPELARNRGTRFGDHQCLVSNDFNQPIMPFYRSLRQLTDRTLMLPQRRSLRHETVIIPVIADVD